MSVSQTSQYIKPLSQVQIYKKIQQLLKLKSTPKKKGFSKKIPINSKIKITPCIYETKFNVNNSTFQFFLVVLSVPKISLPL